MLTTLLAFAFAQDTPPVEDAAEEIIVWGDPFLRWDRRWYVETEVRFAQQFTLFAERNNESRLGNLQMRLVLDCDRDVPLSPKRWEVNCVLEDVGLIALTPRPGAADLLVLQEADAAMTGAHLQLQVSAEGGVPNVDIEGLTPRNERDRRRLEQYRQLLSRAILPFHLGLPPVIADGVKWYEYNSRMMSMPSSYASGGSTTIAHFMDVFEGHLLVQSIGEGVVRPVVGVDVLGSFDNPEVDTYEMNLTGVAIFDLETGIMEERVWAFGGTLTAGSPNVLRGFAYGHGGRLRLLGEQDTPSVGTTYIARSHAKQEGDAPVWRPLLSSGNGEAERSETGQLE